MTIFVVLDWLGEVGMFSSDGVHSSYNLTQRTHIPPTHSLRLTDAFEVFLLNNIVGLITVIMHMTTRMERAL